MSRWKEFPAEPVAGEWTRKQKRAITGAVAALVLGMPSISCALGAGAPLRVKAEMRKVDLSLKNSCANGSNQILAFRDWSITARSGDGGRGSGVLHIFLGLAGAGRGACSALLDSPRMALGRNGKPSMVPSGSGSRPISPAIGPELPQSLASSANMSRINAAT